MTERDTWNDKVLQLLGDDEDLLVSWANVLDEAFLTDKTPQEAADEIMDLESGAIDYYQYERW